MASKLDEALEENRKIVSAAKERLHTNVKKAMKADPDLSIASLAARFHLHRDTVARLREEIGLPPKREKDKR